MLTLHYWQAPSLPGPYLSPGFKDRDAGAVTLEPLAKYDPDGNIEPALATQQQFDVWRNALGNWKDHPGAFGAIAFGEGIAHKP